MKRRSKKKSSPITQAVSPITGMKKKNMKKNKNLRISYLATKKLMMAKFNSKATRTCNLLPMLTL
jgi:hypothetical protein